ncbi:hypothetical protein [Carboxylicivirga sp. N1Y90]|uniref:hypothetical protein n=1 Tax=Carboxylicivirga fragile TaxID=3417571 RepID=UPI003D3567CD|nr:hypothetical protein [Marinilabiliaceae bacterium N1Y90]
MEKEALIDIILNDLKEVHSLITTFKGKEVINQAFINLSHTKLKNISEEINLLESFDISSKNTETPYESSLSSITAQESTEEDSKDIADSSMKFLSGETAAEENKAKIEHKEEPSKNELISETPVTKPQDIIEDKKTEVSTPPKKAEVKDVPQENSSILGEKIKQEATSVNERIADKKDTSSMVSQYGKPVSDVRKAIGLNDRFYFQRELFDGNADAFNNILDQVNQMDSYELALQFIQSNYNWDDDNEVAESFYKSIKRRFI